MQFRLILFRLHTPSSTLFSIFLIRFMKTLIPSFRRGALGSAWLLLMALLLMARPGFAQVDTYSFSPSSGTFTPLPAAAQPVTTISVDDAISGAIPIGFSFTFDGTAYTQVYANSNGFLSFNASAPSSGSYTNALATTAATYRPLAAPYWDDLSGSTGTAAYQTTGTAPNRTFTFEWLNWRQLSGASAQFSFQVQLVEGTNVVRFVYAQVAGAPAISASASIGLAGNGTGPCSFLSLSDASASPTTSSAIEATNIGNVPATGQVYTFTPAAPSACPTPRCLAVSSVTGTTATVTYSVTNTTPGPFTILYGPAGFDPTTTASSTNVYATISATGTTATLTGLTAQTGYQFYVIQNCSGTSGSSTRSGSGSFTTDPNPPTNDECTTALPLAIATSCTTPISGSVFGAAQSLAPTTSCGGTVANDVWYSFVASATALQLTTGAGFSGYYDVRSGACASTTSVTCGVLGTTTATSQAVVSGLTTGQTYFLRVYSTSAQTTAAASAFTLCLTPVINYCNTGLGGSCGGNDITAVTITGTSLNATGLTCTTTSGQAYVSYPATGANTATLSSGVPYQLNVTVDAGSSASIWIDYNHNLAFEASEWTQITANSVGTAATTLTINIPTNAVQGATGMRIRTRSSGSANGAADACTPFFSGETKDFTITIGPPAACPTASNVVVSAITTTTATLTFTPSATATTYTLTLTPQSGTATTSSVTASPVSLTALVPNTTYTLSLVSNCSGSTTSPAVTITFTTPPTPPANDECTTAVAVTVGTTCTTPTTGTVFGASQSLAATTNCGFGITSANDVWYSFVATSASHTITLAPQFAAIYDVRSGACTSTTSVFCATAAAAATTTNTVAGLTVGQTYFVRVYASGTQPNSVAAGTFTLCVVPGPATPLNDECAGALTVPIQFGTCIGQTSADNTAATTSNGAPTPSCNANANRDVWFKVTVPASGAVTVQTVAPTGGSNITDTVINMYSGTCGTLTEIGCNDDANGLLYSQIVLTGRTPGEVLYIRAWSYSTTNSGLIAVCATSPSNCSAPTGLSASNVTSNSAVLNWVAPSGTTTGNTYEIEYGLQNFVLGSGTAIIGLPSVSQTVTVASLLPNTAYCFYVRQNCGAANGSSAYVGPICFTTPQTIPLNDEPCGAVGLATATVTGNTIGATTTVQPSIANPICSSASQPKDVWFAFTAASPTATFAITGAPAGTVRVYSSPSCSAGPFTFVFCAAAAGANIGFSAPVSVTGLTTGQRYYMAVSGYGSSDTGGTFTLTPTSIVTATSAQAETNALLVYPNPSNTGQLTLKLATAGNGQAALLNALGQVVLTKSLTNAPEQTLSTRGLAAGLYTLRVSLDGQTLTRKVVIE
jgi:hypothetical protein